MRISTFQFYQVNTQNIMNKQSKVNESIIHLSEAKRVITAGDDSVAANSIINYKQELRVTEQYQRNIDFADARLRNEETSLVQIENLMNRIKELVLRGNNGSMGPEGRESIAQELENRMEEMLSIANTRDEAGNYIFSGFKTDRVPFAVQPDGSVKYFGDEGVRETTVGSSVTVATNDSGQTLFVDIENSVGDFRPTYGTSNTGLGFVESAKIIDPAAYDPASMPPNYEVNFVDLDGNGELEYQIFDNGGTQIHPAAVGTSIPYSSSGDIKFNGIELVISGEPEVGDTISLAQQETKDIFSSIQEAIDWMRGSQVTDDEKARLQVDIGHILSDLNQGLSHISSARANIGSRMQVTESQKNINEDYLLTIQTTQSSLEDLDIAEASMIFSRQSVALQAAQQSFAQIQGTNLLNFI